MIHENVGLQTDVCSRGVVSPPYLAYKEYNRDTFCDIEVLNFTTLAIIYLINKVKLYIKFIL